MRCLRFVFLAIWSVVTLFTPDFARAADDSLHERIDRLIADAAQGVPLGPTTDDETFVRRVYLDLAGRIPTWHEATGFLEEQGADKRARLIDTLLAGPDFPKRLKDLFHAMLMERRGENPDWERFLESSFASNKPWDQLAREILDPDPANEATRGAAYFHTRRLEKVGQQETDYPGLTRDVGRLFLGVDLQCAQCHNHLFIEEYKQHDFQGLFTVYQNAFIRTDVRFPAIGEKILGKKQEFMSVFDKVPLATGPRVPGGKEIEIPALEKNQEYLLPPDRKTDFPGVPKFSPMKAIAREIATSENRTFLNNIVNRLWFVMMGRGLVNPLDQLHDANLPSHPELLTLLGQEFAAHKLDIKWLLRELALTNTYQRSSVLPVANDVPSPESYRTAIEKRMSAEQILNSVLIATGWREFSAAPTSDKASREKLRLAFVKAFANTAAEPEIDFAPSLRSSLFVLNDPLILDCLVSKPGNLTERLEKLDNVRDLADELYLSVLTRKPTDEEHTAVAQFIMTSSAGRPAAIRNMVWGLLACTEFCLNH
jgi:hypothetical protein